ncbi:hypothetical protein C461_09786 [Halorubrum aidingense JCM 13560]|uniref:DUF7993 domain-containing protein n=1 Tax=Halorubrum aidingense JCM 13560 TaxID=1230454 RepID=M0P9G1_9EURY|nr:hypothetical protein [Halorubrum aidingense]EMA66792.1 hypothetical protein C461_09786 [Halorubrum aidingense JCM 13560]
MTADRLTDGVRIGQLLASEITGNEGRLRGLSLADADPDVDPTPDGALAYAVVRTGGDDDGIEGVDGRVEVEEDDEGVESADADLVAEVYVQPDRVRVEFVSAPDAVADAATEAGLRVRPKAVRPPRTLVFVEDGAQVKRVLPAFEAAIGNTV